MYNKLFTKILDSSIWLTPDPHRIVWITLLAAMDEDGFVQFASVANLAYRARVSPEDAQAAVDAFEAPDTNSGDPENEGRRIEKVPGGWMVLNARKYRDIVTRQVAKETTRQRVAKFREKKRNARVTAGNGRVTPSEADTASEAEASPPQPFLKGSSSPLRSTGTRPLKSGSAGKRGEPEHVSASLQNLKERIGG